MTVMKTETTQLLMLLGSLDRFYEVGKSMKKPMGLICVISLGIALVTVLFLNLSPQAEIDDEMEATIQSALELKMSQSDVVDTSGELKENCLEEYSEKLKRVFSEGSGLIEKNCEIMENIFATYDEYTDITLETKVIDLDIQKVEEDGDKATIVVNSKSVQKYIPYKEFTNSYYTIIAAGKETNTIEMVREDGVWKVQSMNMEDYKFGSPAEMGMSLKNYEKDFPSREEACQYASTIDFDDFKK